MPLKCCFLLQCFLPPRLLWRLLQPQNSSMRASGPYTTSIEHQLRWAQLDRQFLLVVPRVQYT
jgi:hypothetical protein